MTVLLDDVLTSFAVASEPFARCVVSTGFELRLPALDNPTLHYVVQGRGELHVDGEPPRELAALRLAMVPAGRRHTIRSCPDGHGRPRVVAGPGRVGDDGLQEFVAGRDGDQGLQLACGRLEASYAGGVGLFDLLDEPIVLDFGESDAMRRTFERMLAESAAPGPGSATMLAALMSECLVLVFRRLCGSPECHLPWLLALDDPRMASVVEAVLQHPEADHSVESLAAIASMSRSSFALAFAASFNQGPMAFVRQVRLRRGARYLRGTDLPVEVVARRVGFASRSHFSRAFRASFGATPSAFRRHPSGSAAMAAGGSP